MAALLSLEHVAVERGGAPLFSGLNCHINAGEVTVILGPNGAGKSSLLLAISGLIPVSGHIALMGKPLHSYGRQALTQHIAWQGELPPTEFGLTVQQRLDLVVNDSIARHEPAGMQAVNTAMDISKLLSRPLGKLSSGERQRVELAALMLRDSPIWLLDEPTSHLDMRHQIRCIEMLRQQACSRRAIVTVLHDIQQAMAIADHLILIDGKGSAICGSAATLFDNQTLSRLFDAPLVRQGVVLMPDYGEVK